MDARRPDGPRRQRRVEQRQRADQRRPAVLPRRHRRGGRDAWWTWRTAGRDPKASRTRSRRSGAYDGSVSALEIHHLSKTFAGQVVLHDVEHDRRRRGGPLPRRPERLRQVDAHQGARRVPPARCRSIGHGARQPLELGSSGDAHRLNVRFVHQDLGLVNDLSITENIMLGRRYPRRRGGAIDWKAARAAARDVIARAGSSLDVRRSIGELGIADRTRVAIARALPENDDPSIIVLDEPTAALPARDVEQLFGTIRHLTAGGQRGGARVASPRRDPRHLRLDHRPARRRAGRHRRCRRGRPRLARAADHRQGAWSRAAGEPRRSPTAGHRC